MRVKRVITIGFILLVIALVVAFIPKTVGASDGIPRYVEVFEVNGMTCVSARAGSLTGGVDVECYCPCEACVDNTITYIDGVDTKTPVPPAEVPPEPTDVPPPPPTKKPSCNSGIGNGSEDCDPGNSEANNQGGD